MSGATVLGLLSTGVGLVAAAAPLYELDSSWKPNFPAGAHSFSAVGAVRLHSSSSSSSSSSSIVFVSQRGNTSLQPLMALNATDGQLLHSFGGDHVGIDPHSNSWGSHGLAVEDCGHPCSGSAGEFANVRLYVEDFTQYTLTLFGGDGRHLYTAGTKGVAGNGTSPVLQFGHVADAAVQTGTKLGPAFSNVFASDGDGGSANRVVKLLVAPLTSRPMIHVEWATPAIFRNPHSIALHASSGLLVVADREDSELRLLRASDGADLGAWRTCGLRFGVEGVPFGVRALSRPGSSAHPDLLFVASMDNPQDGKWQRIAVLDASQLSETAGARSPCSILQVIDIDPATYSGPHLLGVDQSTGDLYAALVADHPKSTVLRFACASCGAARVGSPGGRRGGSTEQQQRS